MKEKIKNIITEYTILFALAGGIVSMFNIPKPNNVWMGMLYIYIGIICNLSTKRLLNK